MSTNGLGWWFELQGCYPKNPKKNNSKVALFRGPQNLLQVHSPLFNGWGPMAGWFLGAQDESASQCRWVFCTSPLSCIKFTSWPMTWRFSMMASSVNWALLQMSWIRQSMQRPRIIFCHLALRKMAGQPRPPSKVTPLRNTGLPVVPGQAGGGSFKEKRL